MQPSNTKNIENIDEDECITHSSFLFRTVSGLHLPDIDEASIELQKKFYKNQNELIDNLIKKGTLTCTCNKKIINY